MSFQVVAHWICSPCEVEGRDSDTEPVCWNCGDSVTVIARPTVPVTTESDAAVRRQG